MRSVALASAARQRPEVEGIRAVDEAALDLDLRDVAGDRWRIGGLQRRRLRIDRRIGGDGDQDDIRPGDDGGVTGGAGQRPA